MDSNIVKICRFLLAGAATLLVVLMTANASRSVEKNNLTVRIDVSSPVASFMPDEVFGAGLDGLDEIDLETTYSPENIKVMSGAPYRRLSYRLRTELGIEAWHWNEVGQWSDVAKKEGYWISSDKADKRLMKSFGYRLPRRGSTIDQAGNDGYSRLDDGKNTTFWKSNPYLDAHYTGEDNALHPQWIIIDLGKRRNVNALRILWGEPYATRYEVQYWEGKDFYSLNDMGNGIHCCGSETPRHPSVLFEYFSRPRQRRRRSRKKIYVIGLDMPFERYLWGFSTGAVGCKILSNMVPLT
jgi:hypothetical protein